MPLDVGCVGVDFKRIWKGEVQQTAEHASVERNSVKPGREKNVNWEDLDNDGKQINQQRRQTEGDQKRQEADEAQQRAEISSIRDQQTTPAEIVRIRIKKS